jgi:hypothetical protein
LVGRATVVVVIGTVVVVDEDPAVGGRVVSGVPMVVTGNDVVDSLPEFVHDEVITVSATNATANLFIGKRAYR